MSPFDVLEGVRRSHCRAWVAGGWGVDAHPVAFDHDGNGVQAGPDGTTYRYPARCFVTGTIGGSPVSCLSVEQQIVFHSGYEPRDIDLYDLRLLHALGGSKA